MLALYPQVSCSYRMPVRSDVKCPNPRDPCDAGASSFDTSKVLELAGTVFNGNSNFCVTHSIDAYLYYIPGLRELDGSR